VVDVPQEDVVLRRAADRARAAGLEAGAVTDLFRVLVALARRAQGETE
jgi:chorismate mutase